MSVNRLRSAACHRKIACLRNLVSNQHNIVLLLTYHNTWGIVHRHRVDSGPFGASSANLDESADWLWTTLVLLDLQYLVYTCVSVIADIYLKDDLQTRWRRSLSWRILQ
jgi:hypothetical protein